MTGWMKALIVVALIAAIGAVVYAKNAPKPDPQPTAEVVPSAPAPAAAQPAGAALPRLVDLGATKCIPCKMMAPILEELKSQYAGKMDVVFIDVWENPAEAEKYGVKTIPTQVFFDSTGAERFRHEGFYSKEDILAKWKELGVELPAPDGDAQRTFSRLEPAAQDNRPKETICYMCDGDINPKTRTALKTAKGDVSFCSPHCYFIAFSSMVENKPPVESVSVTDWASGSMVPAAAAWFVQAIDDKKRPFVKAFSGQDSAVAEQNAAGGNLMQWALLQEKELATQCGFCDRAVYPEDASQVKIEGGLSTWGCCTMCALGVAARLQKDIEVSAKDALTGDAINVKTFQGHVASLTPHTAVAWAGSRKDAQGNVVSTGCFKQAFFANESNLRQWVEAHPAATGRMVTIEQALSQKMKLTPQQISKACKIGECSPK